MDAQEPGADGRPRLAPRPRRIVTRIAINLVVPPIVYALVRRRVANDATALAIVGAIPSAWTIAFFAWRRWVDPIGVFAVGGFCIAVIVSIATGGSTLPLKLQGDFVLSGVIGLAFLTSAAVRKPLLPPILRMLGRSGTLSPRSANTLTAFIGAILFAAAATHVILALILPTETYVVAARIATVVIYGAGVWLLSLYKRRRRPPLSAPRTATSEQRPAQDDEGDAEVDDEPSHVDERRDERRRGAGRIEA